MSTTHVQTKYIEKNRKDDFSNGLSLWCTDYVDFLKAYNKTIENEGMPLDEWRSF